MSKIRDYICYICPMGCGYYVMLIRYAPRVSAAVPERAAQARDGQPAELLGSWGAAGGGGHR